MNLGMETETVEHKKSTSEMREGMESIASILNKHGHGTLYFGVRPSDGEVIGQDVSEKTLRDVSQAISNRIEPRVYAQIERLATEDGKAYIRVEFSGFETPYSCDGRYRIRSADEDLPMSRAKLQEMMRDAENRSNPWDGRSSGRTVDDVDEDELRRYFERGVEARRITFEYKDRRSALSRLGLLCPGGTLTNAAWVCFADRPEVGLRMGVLGNSTRTDIRDNQQVSGSLFHLVDAAETYILNNTRRAFVIDGNVSMRRQEVPEIPMSAVREALRNAFCHRLYEDLGAVQVDIFWDKVDIYSPGRFPLGSSPEDYLSDREDASRPRNPLIAATLYRSRDIEAYGTGLQRIKEACEAQGVPFEVTQRGDSVHVVFMRQEGIAARKDTAESADNPPTTAKPADKPPTTRRQGKGPADNQPSPGESHAVTLGDLADKTWADLSGETWESLGSNDRRVAEYMAKHGTTTVMAVSEALEIPERTVRDVMSRLVKKGLAEARGANKNRTYTLKDGE